MQYLVLGAKALYKAISGRARRAEGHEPGKNGPVGKRGGAAPGSVPSERSRAEHVSVRTPAAALTLARDEGLAEEIAYLVTIDPTLTVVVSLMRTERKFSAADFRALEGIRPVVDAACRRHWAGLSQCAEADPPALDESIERAFRTIGGGALTPREREVIAFTLRGHSAEAVGRSLGISPGTVRIHRRNIYSKLRISSQGELFSAFLEAIFGRAPGDPSGLVAPARARTGPPAERS